MAYNTRIWVPASADMVSEIVKAQRFANETGDFVQVKGDHRSDVEIDLTLTPQGWTSPHADNEPELKGLMRIMLVDLEAKIGVLSSYLQVCREDRDWHGIGDAAADIREYQAKIDLIEELLK